jgi:hypothetical protein
MCKLFSNSSTSLLSDGFCDWRNIYLVQSHENSVDHRTASVAYLTRKRGSTIDCQLAEQMNNKRQYWKNVLERVVAVIITMAEHGLPFRGDKETFGSPHNGKFLGLLELIAKFDPFLVNHIKEFGNKGSGVTSYLSKTVCDEFIQIMACKVGESISDDLRSAGYTLPKSGTFLLGHPVDGQYCCHSSKMIQKFQSLCQRLDGKHIQWPQMQYLLVMIE